MSTATAPNPGRTAAACYVYGVVPASAPEPSGAPGVGSPSAPVTLVRHGRVAALVSEVDSSSALGTPDDLRAHAKVLDSLAADATTPVLPFRFGGVVSDRQAVVDDLLVPSEAAFAAALDELADVVQYTVRGVYRQDRVLGDILKARPDIARLREQTRDVPADAAYYQQIQLGEMISQEITARRDADGRLLLDRLAPLSEATATGSPSADEAIDAAFLVHRAERAAFEAATEDLARDWADRIELRLLGPLAPYDFAAAVVEQAEQSREEG